MIVRDAEPADYDAYTRLVGELGSGDPVPPRDRFEVHIMPRMTVADAGSVVGYATWRRYGDLAHVVQVAVDRAWRGRRIGEHMLARIRERARAAACERWYLNVKRDNAPALRLYTRCGFAPVGERWALRIAWSAADAMPHAEATEPFIAGPDDDGAIAARLGIPPARIASLRARPDMILVGIRERDAVAGLAAFDPTAHGAAPFAAARPELAGALLAACRPHAARDRTEHVRVTVEGDAALVDTLRAAGAELVSAMLVLDAAL